MFKLAWSKYDRDSTLIVQCRTCNEEFYNTTLEEHAKTLGHSWKSIRRNPRRIIAKAFRGGSPPLWYLRACRHWLETLSDHLVMNDGHEVLAIVKYTEMMGDRLSVFNSDTVFNFSDDWWKKFLREPVEKRNKEAMLNEIKYLEKKLRR